MATRIYKQCTGCNRYYTEKDLFFCLKDGMTLMIVQDEENTSDQNAKTYMPSFSVLEKQDRPTHFACGQMDKTKAEVSAHWDKVDVNLQPTVSAETKQVKKETAKTNEPSQRQKDLLTTMVVTNKKNATTNDAQAKKSNGKAIVIAISVGLMILVVGAVSIAVAGSAVFKSSEATGLIENNGLGSHNVNVPNENDIEGKNKRKGTKTAPVNKPNQGEKKPAETTSQQKTTGQKTTTQTTTTTKTKTRTTTTRQPSTNQEETVQIGGNGIPIVVTIRVP
jgi:hypothetical protein